MRRLFWNRSVYRVRRSCKVKTGPSTTSFHPATGNPIMTSTTYNRSVAHATDESKTVSSKESHGVMPGSNRGRGRKGVGVRLLLSINDLLPYKLRPIKKAGHRRGPRRWYGWRTAVISWRINWISIHKRNLMNKLGLRNGSK
jgi:hypothetical protein